MTKIFNPTLSPLGIRVNGALKVIRPNTSADLDVTQEQLERLIAKGCETDELPTQETASEYDDRTDDELRELAKSSGLNLHHKTGRAKLIEALENN